MVRRSVGDPGTANAVLRRERSGTILGCSRLEQVARQAEARQWLDVHVHGMLAARA